MRRLLNLAALLILAGCANPDGQIAQVALRKLSPGATIESVPADTQYMVRTPEGTLHYAYWSKSGETWTLVPSTLRGN